MHNKFLITSLSVFLLCLLWQLLSIQIGYPAIFPPLFDLIQQIFFLFGSKGFLLDIFSTVYRGFIGFFIAFIAAITLATLSNFSVFWKLFLNPIIVITRSVPVISFVLLSILWFSPNQLPIFIALLTMFPILYQNILTGLEQTDERLLEMARLYGKTAIQRFFTVYLPASKTSMFAGISTAMGFGWRAIIIGEVLAQPIHGIGTAMKQAQAFINVSELIAWTVVAIVVSYIFDVIINGISKLNFEKKLSKYKYSDIPKVIQYEESKLIKVVDLEKQFKDHIVFKQFTFDFNSEKICILKGPSGSGKTTLLRLISGLEKPDSGVVNFKSITHIAYAFQDIRLLPWLTVAENIAYSIQFKKEKSSMVSLLLSKLELTDKEHKYPHELSGGQQQRVGLARALAAKPDVLFLDEPLNGLDQKLKNKIFDYIDDYISTYKPIVIWATHEEVNLPKKDKFDIEL